MHSVIYFHFSFLSKQWSAVFQFKIIHAVRADFIDFPNLSPEHSKLKLYKFEEGLSSISKID